MTNDPFSVLSGAASSSEDELALIASGLRRLWATIVQGMRQGESLSGLHLQQFWVLVLIRQTPQRMSEIAEALQTSQANVTGLIDRLERDGFVSRVRDASDRRVVRVEITSKGHDTIEVLGAQYRGRVDDALHNLSREERSQLLALLTKSLDGHEASA